MLTSEQTGLHNRRSSAPKNTAAGNVAKLPMYVATSSLRQIFVADRADDRTGGEQETKHPEAPSCSELSV